MEPGADLVILFPDGKEEVLVPVTEKEAIADPNVSFDGEWVYFSKFHDATNRASNGTPKTRRDCGSSPALRPSNITAK